MKRRIAGVFSRPRATFAELARQPRWWDTWILILAVWSACGAWLLTNSVGRQALVDERVRADEAFGGRVSDDEYRQLQANPPLWTYVTSGGRLLLSPPVTLMAAAGLWLVARRRANTTFEQALAVAVHASVVLAAGQVLATPMHYVRESLTSPFNLAAVLPLMEEGTLRTRFFGSVDVFAVWWAGLMALGLAVLTGRPARKYVWMAAVGFVAFAGLMTAVMAMMGGS